MSTLQSGLDEVRGTELRSLSDSELVDLPEEVRGAMSALAAEDGRILAEAERREVFARDGHLSMTSWVEHRLGTSWSEGTGRTGGRPRSRTSCCCAGPITGCSTTGSGWR